MAYGTTEEDKKIGVAGYILMGLSFLVVLVFFPFSMLVTFKLVRQFERGAIFRFGIVVSDEAKGPGLHFVLPFVDQLKLVDCRAKVFDIKKQKLLTKDMATVTIDGVVFGKIVDPMKSAIYFSDPFYGVRVKAATTLRNVVGKKTLSEVVAHRKNIAQTIKATVDRATKNWGMVIERVEIKSITMPTDFTRSMAVEAETARKARAKVLAAEGEQKASLALKEAADVIMESPAALQLRNLQTLNKVAVGKDTTILFPLPINLLTDLKR